MISFTFHHFTINSNFNISERDPFIMNNPVQISQRSNSFVYDGNRKIKILSTLPVCFQNNGVIVIYSILDESKSIFY